MELTQPTQIQLTVTMDPRTGQIGVSGPIDQKVICLGMLAMAEQVIKEFDPAKAARGIAVANGVLKER